MRPSLRAASVLCFGVSISIALLALVANRGEGLPLYAARQGLMCQQCHFDPNGGGPRNAFGFQFEKNRHSTDAEAGGMFKDLDLTNRVGETMPVYFGVDHRLMSLVDDRTRKVKGIDRFGFYDMESSILLAFQPHERLSLVYTTDGLNGTPRVTREAWGMIGLGNNHYLRAGQFRIPFGLRIDDHTVASRNGFLDFQTRNSVLPYDPRLTDQGVELGGSHGSHFGRIAFTNGLSNILSAGPRLHAQTVSAKIGYSGPVFQDGYSGYDEWDQSAAPGDRIRASRWGWYGLAHRAQWSLLAEVVAGTDRLRTAGPTDQRINRLGYFAEADYQLNRGVNFRVRYDRLETDRSSNSVVRDQNSFNRYALEGEVVPVPFAEIRWTLRMIDPVAELPANPNREKQAYVQFHFSY